MEKIEGITFVSKDYLLELMQVILTTEKVDKLQKVIRKIDETAFIDIAFDLPLRKYKPFFEKLIHLRMKGYTPSSIKEELDKMYPDILKELDEKFKNKHLPENAILEVFEKKLKTVHLLDFLFKYARLNTEIKDNDEVLNQLIKEINNLYRNIADDSDYIEKDYTDENDIKSRLRNRILRLFGKSSSVKVISTGISLLDAVFRTKKGMESGELYIIGAPYGMGKTRFVVRLGTNMYLNGANIYHITIENKMEDVEELYDIALTGLSPEYIYGKVYNEIRKLNIDNEEELQKEIDKRIEEYERKIKEIYESRDNKIFIKKYHPYKVSVNDIKSWIAAKIQETGKAPDVIIVDHMDILIPSTKSKSEMSLFQKGEIIAGELKTLAEQFNAIVLTPTQMNREGVKENTKKKGQELGGESTSRSMAKNELTGFLMTLNQNREEALHGFMRLFIDKNRIGIDKVVIPVRFDKSTLKLEPITNDEILANFSENVRVSVQHLLDRYYGNENNDLLYTNNNDSKEENQDINQIIDDVIEDNTKEDNKQILEFEKFTDLFKACNSILISNPNITYEVIMDNDKVEIHLEDGKILKSKKPDLSKIGNDIIEKLNMKYPAMSSILKIIFNSK